MICVWAMNSSGSCWVSKFLSAASMSQGGGRVVIEPWSCNAHPQWWRKGGLMVDAVAGCTDLLGRWEGRNEDALSVDDRERVAEFCRLFETTRPQAVGFKTLIFPYPEVWREVWPSCPVVSIARGLEGFLCCLARKTNRFSWYLREPWWYNIGERPPWYGEADAMIEGGECPDRLRPLLSAALHRRHYLRIREAVLPADALRVTHEDLCANWDYEMPRLLTHCGLPVLPEDTLREWAQPVPREWGNTQFTRADVARVVDIMASKESL